MPKYQTHQDEFGTHVDLPEDIAQRVAATLIFQGHPVTIYHLSLSLPGWSKVSIPSDIAPDNLRQAISRPGPNWPGEVAAIWARLERDRADDAREMARMLTTQPQRDQALAEMKAEDDEEG
jgi:hypothetical protein